MSYGIHFSSQNKCGLCRFYSVPSINNRARYTEVRANRKDASVPRYACRSACNSVKTEATAVSRDMPTAQGKLRLLGLHGWRTSARVLQWQFDKYSLLGQKLSDLVEVTYIDAPHLASGSIPDGVADFVDGPYFEWWNATKRNTNEHEYEGMEASLEFVLEYIRSHGPFDGLMGFSQGGTVSGIIAAYCQAGQALEASFAPKFCLIFSGLLSRDYRHLQLYDQPIDLPAFIVYGEKDPGSRYTKKLAGCFSNPIVVAHPGGHVVPRLGTVEMEQLQAFLAAQRDSKM